MKNFFHEFLKIKFAYTCLKSTIYDPMFYKNECINTKFIDMKFINIFVPVIFAGVPPPLRITWRTVKPSLSVHACDVNVRGVMAPEVQYRRRTMPIIGGPRLFYLFFAAGFRGMF